MFLFFSFLFACQDYTVAGIEKRQADILVYPNHINFGHLLSGVESDSQTFIVANAGDEDLNVFAPELISGNGRFSLQTEGDSYVVAAGELQEFTVTYEPETYEANGGYIDIVSDDEDEPLMVVTLEGYGDAPVMTVSPLEFDYGDISIGCDNEERITIRNNGNLDLTIDSITQMVTQPVDILFELGSLPPPPWVLAPNTELDFLVSYVPTDIGADDSSITIVGNDPVLPELEVTQHGDGDVEQWVQQQWEQDEIPVLDILWVIDDSGSMSPFQQNLSLNIGSFMSAFLLSGADYNMSVITTSDPFFNVIVDSSYHNPEQTMSGLVVTGIMGGGIERGLQMAKSALQSGAAAPGGAFFRADAKLVVIFVSDEPDQSIGGWSSYLPFFDAIKPLGDFIPFAGIGDHPSGCTYNYNGLHRNAAFGAGYWDIVDHYGGSWYSICANDWGVQLQSLANEVTERRSFILDEPDPIEDTIEVKVNGQATSEWEYDASLNAVIFSEGHVPTEGQTITIDYALWGCGEE